MLKFFGSLMIALLSYAVGYWTQGFPVLGGFWVWGWIGGCIAVGLYNQSNK